MTGPFAARLVGVDALRAVAALTVLFDHLGVLPPALFGDARTGLPALARLLSNCLFNGPAAVIVFFVISGFCIHFPQARAGTSGFDIRRFYVRRALRIGLPALAAVAVYRALGLPVADLDATVLWSIVCEAVYYLLYPALLMARQAVGWVALLVAAYAVATALCAANPDALHAAQNGYTALGGLTWIVGLPCWLLGCWLAEHRRRFPALPGARLWAARAAILALAVALRIAKFHLPWVVASNCFTLNLFALPATAWVGLELAGAARAAPSRLLEWAGRWSYSLYLIHPAAPALLALAGVAAAAAEPFYLAQLATALVGAFGFFVLVERPVHRLAVAATRRPRKVRALPQAPLGPRVPGPVT